MYVYYFQTISCNMGLTFKSILRNRTKESQPAFKLLSKTVTQSCSLHYKMTCTVASPLSTLGESSSSALYCGCGTSCFCSHNINTSVNLKHIGCLNMTYQIQTTCSFDFFPPAFSYFIMHNVLLMYHAHSN